MSIQVKSSLSHMTSITEVGESYSGHMNVDSFSRECYQVLSAYGSQAMFRL